MLIFFTFFFFSQITDLHLPRSVLKDSFPDLPTIPYLETILGPGDQLFLPRHSWHYVQSLSEDLLKSLSEGMKIIYYLLLLLFILLLLFLILAELKKFNIQSIEDFQFSISVNHWWGDKIIKKYQETNNS